jgi:hypothetical protein
MIESPLLLEYRNEILQDNILFVLRRKFGAVQPEVEARIRAVQDAQRLNELTAQVAMSPDLGTFQVHLASP